MIFLFYWWTNLNFQGCRSLKSNMTLEKQPLNRKNCRSSIMVDLPASDVSFFGGVDQWAFYLGFPSNKYAWWNFVKGMDTTKHTLPWNYNREFSPENQFWVVVSNIFDCHPELGKWSNLTNIFQIGWIHHPEFCWRMHFFLQGGPARFQSFCC